MVKSQWLGRAALILICMGFIIFCSSRCSRNVKIL